MTMKIESIKLRNIKGHTASYDLGGVTVIVGYNAAGKTLIPTAIRLGLCGYLPPPLGKTPGSLYKLAGNYEQPGSMGVDMTLTGGRATSLTFTKGPKGTVSLTGGVPSDLVMPELLMEPRLFFAKTGAQRVQTILDACDVSRLWTGPEQITRRWSEIDVRPVVTAQAALDEIDRIIAACFVPSFPVAAALAQVIERAELSGKEYAKTAKEKSGAFEAFRSKTATARPKDLCAELQAARDELARLNAGGKPCDAEQSELDRLRATLAPHLADGQTIGQLVDARIAEHAKIQADLLRLVKPEPLAEDMADRYEAAKESLAEAESQLQDANRATHTAGELLASLGEAECCETCGNKAKGWHKKAMTRAEESRAEAVAQFSAAVAQAATRKVQADSLAKTIGEHAKADELFHVEQSRLAALLAVAEAKIKTAKQFRDRMKWLEEQIAANAGTSGGAAIKAAQAKVDDLACEQEKFTVFQSDITRRDTLEGELLTAQGKADTFKAALKIIREEQEKLCNSAFGDVLKVARRFTDGLLNSPLEFHDMELGRRISQADLDAGNTAPIGSWVSHETLSGTEELLAYAGFSVALASKAPIKLVVMDELGRVETKRRELLIRRMRELVNDGTIDQFVGCDVSRIPASQLSDVTLIEV